MPSVEDSGARRPHQHQQRQRPDLNINTAATRRPPLTLAPKGCPPVSAQNQRYSNKYSPASTHESGESFLENETPIDQQLPNNKENQHPGLAYPRDSHDLSLPSGRDFTRDSLVTNMLSSLDQFSLTQINTPVRNNIFDEGDGYPNIPRTMTSTSRPHLANHVGHSYSYSSDLEDDTASRISSQFSRGRRSNSSSGPQSSSGRRNSIRDQQYHQHRSVPGTPAASRRPLHSRGGKTSKSSSTNSIDAQYAQAMATQRWANGVGGRSSSFDYGQQRPSLDPPPNDTFLVEDYEAAPTPTIASGPRRPLAPPSPAPVPSSAPPTAPAEPEPKTPDRKRNTRSRSGTGGKSVRAKSSRANEPPPLPAVSMLDSAPAPNVGYNKPSETSRSAAPTSNANTKEKPGFFRRVFGSRNASSNNTSVPLPPPPPEPVEPVAQQPPLPPPTTASRPVSIKSQHATSAQMKNQSQSAPPSRDAQQPPPPMPHVIHKKSSFFRRRKKSITEPPVPTPPVPAPINLNLTRHSSIAAAEPSPVSSLRQVMNPYLKGSTPSTPSGLLAPQLDLQFDGPSSAPFELETTLDEANRKTRGFSPDYEPSPSATIRTVKSQSALKTRGSTTSLSRPQTYTDSPKREPPAVPSAPKEPNTKDTTFFNESSDEGEGPDRTSQLTAKPSSGQISPMAATMPRSAHGSPALSAQTISKKQSFNRAEPSPRLLLQTNNSTEDALSKSVGSLPSLRVDTAEPSPSLMGQPIDEPIVSVGEPTEYDQQKAKQIFDGSEEFIQKDKAASWMGEEGLVRQRVLRAYMDLYDFSNQSVLNGLRQICGRLVLRAETQQVDRILVAFSKRWCDCNPNHGFKATDVIHTMCYSIMLLNTDLHLADIEQKMSRSQFVKNTMTTVKHALTDIAPEAFNNRSSILPSKTASLLSPAESEVVDSPDQERASWRSSFRPLPRSESALGSYTDNNTTVDTCGPLVKIPFEGTMRAWEGQMELVLKDIYTSIRDTRLPLFGADANPQPAPPPNSLFAMSKLKRSPSVLSKAPSESQVSVRGRMVDPARNTTGRWASKSRSRPRLANGFSSSRTSFDDGGSMWSPATSSATWSKYSLGRTQTSGSVDTFNSAYPTGDYQQSIGFANALSQAIIREDYPIGDSSQSIMSAEIPGIQMLDDESLELAGPPWVKEGMVTHKHHLDGVDKKAKERNWSEVFAVIQKGTLSLFSFSTKSMRQKSRPRKGAVGPGMVVGGGNWQDNATTVGTFSLRQTLASALPPPGYSRARPNVWALSLPTGAVHLFQVGTPEISKEFVTTVNYWSARLSTHPLVGGISNIEYGWSDSVINESLISPPPEAPVPPRPGSAAAGRSSMHSRQSSRQSSLRSSFDVGGGSGRVKLPGDRINIHEWAPPAQSMRPSNCSESEQLKVLMNYVQSIEEDLQKHNQLRSPMLLAFAPRGHNSNKAMANWERKSSYLLREIVKFRTYVDCLQTANTRRTEIYTERDNARRAAMGEDLETEDEGDTTLRPE